MMQLETTTRGEVTVLKVIGSVQSKENKAFAAKLAELRTSGVRRLIVDAEKLEYMNSQGIADLMVFYHRHNSSGGEMALVGLRPIVEKVVRAVGLSELVGICDTVEEAEAFWS
jgi:anti-anti-sigma factor